MCPLGCPALLSAVAVMCFAVAPGDSSNSSSGVDSDAAAVAAVASLLQEDE
eukprot:COSAG05_NODE_1294_length_5255_cov_3.346974_1_plen_50_part_10